MQEERKNSDLAFNCAICSGIFEDHGVALVEETEAKTILHATCSKCLTATLIFLSKTEKGMISVGMATDLNRNEAFKIFSEKPISADEVIEVYRKIHAGEKQRK